MRLLADFPVGERVFEIGPESPGQQLRTRSPRFREPHHSLLAGSALDYRYKVMCIYPLHTVGYGLDDALQAKLGLGGAADSCFGQFFGEIADKMAQTSTKWRRIRGFLWKCRIPLDSTARLVHYPQSC